MIENMVVIECPHCDEDIEMDDDAFGLFDCPYCDNEYEWGEEDNEITHRDFSYPSFGIEEIATAIYSLILLIIVIVGFSSTSWYSIEETLSIFDLHSESGFGLSEVETSLDTNSYGDESPTFGYVEGGNFEDLEQTNNKNANEMRELCIEFDVDECDDLQKRADWYGDWDSSGVTMKIFLFLALFSLIGLLCMKGAVFLNEFGKLNLSAEWSSKFILVDIIGTIVTALLLISGCLIYAIICPELTKSMLNGGTQEISSGMGSMWWTTFVLSMGSMVIPVKNIISNFTM